MDRDRLLQPLPAIVESLTSVRTRAWDLANKLECDAPATAKDIDRLRALSDRVASAPDLQPSALAEAAWAERLDAIDALIDAGMLYNKIVESLAGLVTGDGWLVDAGSLESALAKLPDNFSLEDFLDLTNSAERIPDLLRIQSAWRTLWVPRLAQPYVGLTALHAFLNVWLVPHRPAPRFLRQSFGTKG